MSKDVAEEYTSSLNDLTVNSKPLINMLTMLAEDYIEHAPIIVKAVEVHLQKVQGDVKLPVLYLIDSIVKNVKRDYIPLFTQNIVSTFCSVFAKVDEKVKLQMFKLRQTWNDIFPKKKLYALDARVNAMDPEWPITISPQAVRIHVNPKFFQAGSSSSGKQPRLKFSKDEPKTSEKEKSLNSENTTFRTRDPRIRVKESNEKATLSSTVVKSSTAPPKIKIPKSFDQSVSSSSSSSKVSPSSAKNKKNKKSKKTKSHHTSKYEVSVNNEVSKEASSQQAQPEDVLRKESKSMKVSERNKLNEEKQVKTTDASGASHNYRSNTWTPDARSTSPKAQSSEMTVAESVSESQKPQSVDKITKEKTTPPNKSDLIEIDITSDSSNTPPIISPIKFKGSNMHSHKKKLEKKTAKTKSEKRKHTHVENTSMQMEETSANDKTNTGALPLVNNSKDIDLRLLPSHNKTMANTAEIDDLESKNKMMDTLFGPQDVDLRTFPLQPPTPPPPIISRRGDQENSIPSNAIHSQTSGNWANYKGTKSDETPYTKKFNKNSTDRLGRPFFYNEDKVKDSEKFEEEAPEECISDNCNLIIKQAEEQLNSGNITFSQYNSMLKAVIKINEERKLQEALKQDELNQDHFGMDVEENELPKESFGYMDHSENSSGFKRKYDDASYNGDEFEQGDSSKQKPDSRKRTKVHVSDPPVNRLPNDRGRYGNRYDNQSSTRGGGNQKPWLQKSSRPHPTPVRGDFKRWPHPTRQIFEPNKAPFRYRGPIPPVTVPPLPPPPPPLHLNQFGNMRGAMGTGINHLPRADPHVLEIIAKDTMKNIIYEGVPREVRFYGDTAIIMLSWDDPREITFQPGSKTLVIDDREVFTLQFNAPYKEFIVDGARVNIRLGAPTRELYIDGMFYEVIFGGAPVNIMFGGRMHSVCMPGPTPQVKFSDVKRTDLVAGKVNLIVDANEMFPIYLDAKPQRFEIERVPYILRFVEALQTVVINGVPFKIEFGGTPVPIYFQGAKHYLRLSVLPRGIKPGYINIVNMEGGRLPSPPPSVSPPTTSSTASQNSDRNGIDKTSAINSVNTEVDEVKPQKSPTVSLGNDQPLELLASLMPGSFTPPSVGQSYSAELTTESSTASTITTDVTTTTSTVTTSTVPDMINVSELLKKLVAVGIVPAVNKEKEKESSEDLSTLKMVDFSQPETLKVKQPALVTRLYSGIQCSSCGVRFSPEETVKYSQHLDWHFRQNRRDRDSARIAQSRKWNYDVSDWIQYQEIEDLEERAQSWFEMQEKKTVEGDEMIEEEPSVVIEKDEDNASCCICQDRFEVFYNEEKEEWHLRMAVRMEEKLYHPMCYKDYQDNLLKEDTQFQESSYFLQDENETIEIVDDSVTESTVISIEDEKSPKESGKGIVEETEKEETKSTPEPPAPEEVQGEKTPHADSDSDDDILQIEVIEPTIESFEILDEDDDDVKDNTEEKKPMIIDDSEKLNNSDDGLETDFTNIVIKKEKEVILPEPAITSHHTTIISSIDGNVELDEAPPLVQPKKININITSSLTKSKKLRDSDRIQLPTNTVTEFNVKESSQPLPPGELFPACVKPKIHKAKLTELPPVNKGVELSGLCCLM
ncbi:uncharacterized protein LOC106663303 isoform X2 [Cimex lectularius]|uniref:Pre-mRNA cleavage complex 2 protein Pcf11 n=1 Tax=Cimex lectularius TaxID=79782 RepID=A0A8I6RE85_CIMLE|nr:uncharacterized protein LOC106663303 isoform X2 [Cimex lectularius]